MSDKKNNYHEHDSGEVSFNNFLHEKGDFFKTLIYLSIHVFLIMIMLSFAKISILQSYTGFQDIIAYLLIAFIALISGLLAAFIFSKINETSKYIVYGVAYSSILAVIFSINSAIKNVILKLLSENQFIADVRGTNCSGLINFVESLSKNIFDPNIGFSLAFIIFNIPFVAYYLKMKKKKYGLFFLYIIPIIIFILFSLALVGISNWIIGRYY